MAPAIQSPTIESIAEHWLLKRASRLDPTADQRTLIIVACIYVVVIILLWNLPYVKVIVSASSITSDEATLLSASKAYDELIYSLLTRARFTPSSCSQSASTSSDMRRWASRPVLESSRSTSILTKAV